MQIAQSTCLIGLEVAVERPDYSPISNRGVCPPCAAISMRMAIENGQDRALNVLNIKGYADMNRKAQRDGSRNGSVMLWPWIGHRRL